MMGTLLINVTTLAQTVTNLAPKEEKWPAVLFAVVLFLCVFAISVLPARRTHLD
jgi:hypothetical protein